jgi:hypothetical protein
MRTEDVPTSAGGLSATSITAGRIDLFVVQADGSIVLRTMRASLWGPEVPLGGRAVAAPAVAAWGQEMELFAVFDDGQLWDRYWESLGGELAGPVSASSWGPERLDVFAVGRDRRLWHRWWDGSSWVPWETL